MTPPPDVPREAHGPHPEALLAEVGWLRALARRLARDDDVADDLAQGALAVALENPPKGERPLRPWLASVVHNLARRRRRAEARRVAREHAASRAEAVGPEGALLEQFEEQQRVARLVHELEPELRVLVLRRFWRGESAAEIARSTGQKPGTVRARLARALRDLRAAHRRELGERGSLAALGIASTGATTQLATFLGSLVAMKTAAKLAAVSAVVLVGFLGVRALHQGRADARVTQPAERTAALELDLADAPPDEAAAASTRTELAAAAPETGATPPIEQAPAAEPPGVGLRAVDEDGAPVEGARLHFTRLDGSLRDLPPSEPSGPDGRIAVLVPREATFRWAGDARRLAPLSLVAPGRAASFFTEGLPAAGLEELGDRVLRAGSSVRGLVLDDRGVPAPGVTVAVRGVHAERSLPQGVFSMRAQPDAPNEREATLRTITGADGTFELRGLVVGPNEFWFRKPGRPWNEEGPFESLPGARRDDVVLRLPAIDPARLVQGRVLTPDGVPCSGAYVLHGTARGFAFWSEDRLAVDEHGRFELVTSPGAAVSFAAFADDDAFGPSATTTGVAGGSSVDLRLTPARSLRVVVRDAATGEPLERAWILPRMGVTATGSEPQVHGAPESGDTQGRDFARTDAGGVVALLAPPAAFSLRVGCRGYDMLDLGDFDPDALPEEVVCELVREPELTGVVLAGGAPVAGARVYLQESWPAGREMVQGFSSRLHSVFGPDVVTDDAGRFRQPVDPDREYPLTLLVEADGFARAEHRVGVVPDARAVEPIEVELARGGRLEGRVVVAAGRSPLGVVIGISREDGRPLFTRTDAEGRYAFDHLTPGPWELQDLANEPTDGSMAVLQEGEEPFRPTLDVREGLVTRHDLDLRWQADARINGRLTIDGAPPGEGWIAIVEADVNADGGAAFQPVELDGDGRFSVPAAPGPAVLLLREDEGAERWTFRRELRLTADTAPVELDLRTATLGADDRAPHEPFRVRARHDELGELTQWFEADGDGALRATVVAWPQVVVERERREGEERGDAWASIQVLEPVPGGTYALTER